MTPPMIDDSKVDALEIVWDESQDFSGPRLVNAPPELRMLGDFLTRSPWEYFARFIAPGARHHHGRVAEYSGFTFQSDLDPDDEPFEGVQLFDPIDTIYISEHAFDRLMSRFFSAIVEGATRHHKAAVHESWWAELVAAANELEARARGQRSIGSAEDEDGAA